MQRVRKWTIGIAMVAGLAAGLGFSEGALGQVTGEQSVPALRPPAVPLVAIDPYLSIWSMSDRLADDATRHWTRHPHPLTSLIRIDGKTYRLMGPEPRNVPAMSRSAVQVFPTRTIYEFDDGHVHVTLTFLTPALPDDLDVLARPLTYLTWEVRSPDGGEHAVSIYDGTSALLAVNSPSQKVEWKREAMGDLTVAAGRHGGPDAAPAGRRRHADRLGLRLRRGGRCPGQRRRSVRAPIWSRASSKAGKLPGRDDDRMPRAADDLEPCLAFAFDLGKVGAAPVSRHLMIAYDEIYAIKFLGQKLRPFWRRNGAEPADLFRAAERDYATLVGRCEAFDRDLMADLTRAGGVRVCADRGPRVSPGAGWRRPRGRRQQAADALPEGEQQQRLRRDG